MDSGPRCGLSCSALQTPACPPAHLLGRGSSARGRVPVAPAPAPIPRCSWAAANRKIGKEVNRGVAGMKWLLLIWRYPSEVTQAGACAGAMGRPAPRGHARGYRELGLRLALTGTLLTAPWRESCQVQPGLTARAGGRYGPKGGAGTGAGPAARTQGPIPGHSWEGLGQSACSGGA